MKNPTDPDDYELKDEYDLSKMTVVAKGRYAPERRGGKVMTAIAQPSTVAVFRLPLTLTS